MPHEHYSTAFTFSFTVQLITLYFSFEEVLKRPMIVWVHKLGTCSMQEIISKHGLHFVSVYLYPVLILQSAVQVLNLVQEILPPAATLNSHGLPSSPKHRSLEPGALQENTTTSQHYAVVESDHPYKPATVANYKVTFFSFFKFSFIQRVHHHLHTPHIIVDYGATCNELEVASSFHWPCGQRRTDALPHPSTDLDTWTKLWGTEADLRATAQFVASTDLDT
jgi:hypothetical protein